MSQTRIAVNGAEGRMGSRILALASESKLFEVVAAFDEKKTKEGPLSANKLKGSGVLIDFSSPAGTLAAADCASKARWGLVVGTTGLDDTALKALAQAARVVPVVHSSNMSVGVNLALKLVSLAAKALGEDFDIEISEAHHRHKKDAPSGTALMLAQEIAKAKNWDLKKVMRYRQAGKSDTERGKNEIGMQVVRAGEIVGDHTVLFGGPSEIVEITHRAQSRDAFARGALAAARFAAKKSSGLYTMADVLF